MDRTLERIGDRQLMRVKSLLPVLTMFLACSVARANPGSPPRKCPVAIDRVELSYSHQGGPSKPELMVSFGNDTGQRIMTVKFSLSVLDSSGYPQPYPDELIYSDGLDAGKKKVFLWELAPASVNIDRAGETIVVQRVQFADTSGLNSLVWTDDGSESCKLTVDYHAN